MEAAPTAGPQARVLAVGEGQEPTGSSPLTCEGQCSDSHSTVRFPHPCLLLSLSAWSTMHILRMPRRPPSSVPGPCFLRAHPLWLYLAEASWPCPCPWVRSLVQLPEPSLQPLLHGGWVLTASSSFFWKADDVAILNSCTPGLRAPRDCLARPLLLAFSICGGSGMFCVLSFSPHLPRRH